MRTSIEKVFWVLSRSSMFSCLSDVPHTTEDCSSTLLQNKINKRRGEADWFLIEGSHGGHDGVQDGWGVQSSDIGYQLLHVIREVENVV